MIHLKNSVDIFPYIFNRGRALLLNNGNSEHKKMNNSATMWSLSPSKMSMKWKETEETSHILTVVKLLNIINDNYCSNTGHCLFSLMFSDLKPTTEQIIKEICIHQERLV